MGNYELVRGKPKFDVTKYIFSDELGYLYGILIRHRLIERIKQSMKVTHYKNVMIKLNKL